MGLSATWSPISSASAWTSSTRSKSWPQAWSHGGIDTQSTLPFGPPEDVRAEVLDRVATLGAGGGYIIAPSHNIQPDTSAENILAMYEPALRAPR